jgi:hypothetical protein
VEEIPSGYDFEKGDLKVQADKLRAIIAPETVSDVTAEQPPEGTSTETNLDDLDISPDMMHMYKKAKIKETPEGPRFVAPYHEFTAVSRPYSSGKEPQMDKNGLPRNIGDYITMMINGPDNWKLSAVMPNGSGMCAAIFERTVSVALPTPEPLVKTEPTAAPTETDLAGLAARAAQWANPEVTTSARKYTGDKQWTKTDIEDV